MHNIRFGGAQIPCTDSLENNLEILKKSIDWASKNEVNYLLTPEGSLSGYIKDFDSRNGLTFDDILSAEKSLIEYSKEKNVGLILGTMWIENHTTTPHRENQQRFYSPKGEFLGKTNKTYIIPEYDQTVPNGHIDNVILSHQSTELSALGLICNDFWGGPIENKVSLPMLAPQLGSHIILHSTNGYRSEDKNYSSLTNDWHNGCLRIFSWSLNLPIITVDNCWTMHGKEWQGSTSSESGVLIKGQWKTSVPRTGTQYFYYDFSIPKLLTYKYNGDDYRFSMKT